MWSVITNTIQHNIRSYACYNLQNCEMIIKKKKIVMCLTTWCLSKKVRGNGKLFLWVLLSCQFESGLKNLFSLCKTKNCRGWETSLCNVNWKHSLVINVIIVTLYSIFQTNFIYKSMSFSTHQCCNFNYLISFFLELVI